jgi:hypothetical protein
MTSEINVSFNIDFSAFRIDCESYGLYCPQRHMHKVKLYVTTFLRWTVSQLLSRPFFRVEVKEIQFQVSGSDGIFIFLNKKHWLGQIRQYSVSLRIGRPRFDPRQRQRIFPLASVSSPALRLTQPPTESFPGVKHGRGVTLTTHPPI